MADRRSWSRPGTPGGLAALILMLSACSHAASGAAPAPKSSTPRCASERPVTGAVVLTERNSPGEIRLRVGQRVLVRLPGGDYDGYRIPAVTGAAIREVSHDGGYPSRCEARAVYLAVAPGAATLKSQTDFVCLHAKPPCLPPSKTWAVRVSVVRR